MTMPSYAQDTESDSSVSDDDTPISIALSPGDQLGRCECTDEDAQSELEFIPRLESDEVEYDDDEAEKRSLVQQFYKLEDAEPFESMKRRPKEVRPCVKESSLNGCSNSYDIFRLFFDDVVINRMKHATNEYARVKILELRTQQQGSKHRPWRPVTKGEILFYIASHVYMGVVRLGDKRNYFADGRSSALHKHHALSRMSRER